MGGLQQLNSSWQALTLSTTHISI